MTRIERFVENPLITKTDLPPSDPGLEVACVLNPGVFRFEGATWLLLRVAERPPQVGGFVSFPVREAEGTLRILRFAQDDPGLDLSDPRLVGYQGRTYLSTLSHLRLLRSDDGVHFAEPVDRPARVFGQGPLETFGIEDARVAAFEGAYHITYTQVSENGVGVGLFQTRDWRSLTRRGMIFPPHNKDCCLFEERIGGAYVALHRPSGVAVGGSFIWLARSPDLVHWGDHHCLLRTRPGHWDSGRVGAGASPIATDHGWLVIYHGADVQHRYALGAVLLDRDDPTRVLARSDEPLMTPSEPYEQHGFFGQVVFTNGHVVDGDTVTIYYGAADEVICGARLSIAAILDSLRPTRREGS